MKLNISAILAPVMVSSLITTTDETSWMDVSISVVETAAITLRGARWLAYCHTSSKSGPGLELRAANFLNRDLLRILNENSKFAYI